MNAKLISFKKNVDRKDYSEIRSMVQNYVNSCGDREIDMLHSYIISKTVKMLK